jgi:hypothetical protein
LERAQLFLSLGHRELQNGRVQTVKMLIMESKKKKKKTKKPTTKKTQNRTRPRWDKMDILHLSTVYYL